MRRRRIPRRPQQPRPSSAAGGSLSGPLRQLNRAHRLLENGQHADAAFIFERLARAAHDRGFLRHVPYLYLQAARAQLLAGNLENGRALLFESLAVFAAEERWPALAKTGRRAMDELNQLGHEDIALEISQWLSKYLPESAEQSAAIASPTPRLPVKCPFCGGVLRPGEIEMLDQITAECPYCGSTVREAD